MAGDPKTSRRALRVGLLLRGNLVEERLFGDGLPITIGQSLKCRLSLPADGMPLEHVLFVRDQDRWLLHVATGMTGRIAQGEQVITELPAGPIALERGVRGRLSLGDATILFQEIAAQPAQPRPQLPASVRGTFADRIDRRLAVIIGGSLIAHLGIAAWAWVTESEEPPPGQLALADFHQETMEIQLPDDIGKPVVKPDPSTEPGVAAPATPKQVTAPIVKPTHVAPPGPPDPSHLAEDAKKFAALLTGEETSAHGTTADMRITSPAPTSASRSARSATATTRSATVRTARATRTSGAAPVTIRRSTTRISSPTTTTSTASRRRSTSSRSRSRKARRPRSRSKRCSARSTGPTWPACSAATRPGCSSTATSPARSR